MMLTKSEKIEIERIAKEKGLSIKEIEDVIESMYEFIREKASSIDYKEKEYTREEFNSLKTNFNIPCIGKFCVSYIAYKKINKIK